MLTSDRWSAIINGTGLALYIVATTWSTWLAASSGFLLLLLMAVLYIITTLFYWIINTTYHILKREDHPREILRRLDHCTLFFLIAGTYTPCIVRYCDPVLAIIVIIVLWICVAISTPLMLFWKKGPSNFSTLVTFSMGMLVIVTLSLSIASFPPFNAVLFFVGAGLFIVGGIVFAMKKPNLRPGVFTFHELFHSFVLAAMVVMYFLVLSAISV